MDETNHIIIEVKDSGERYVAGVCRCKVHQICKCQTGNLKPEYRRCAFINSPEF